MKNTLTFLKKLKKNNNRDWMMAHKGDYLTAKKEFEFLVQELIMRISAWDSRLPHLEPKNCMFRINRDVRFSDDKSPYKDNFGAYFAYGGKKGGLPGYYLHISPGEIFAAAGVWMPEADKLLSIRRHIMNHGDDLGTILKDKKFKKTFGGLNTEMVLKRPPKGFPAEHVHVEWLKYKSFTVSHSLNQSDVLKPGLGKKVEQIFKVAMPLNRFLDEAIRTN